MKNICKVLGIIALVAVTGFGFVSCDDVSGGGGSSGGGGVATNGKVIITGLGEHNGKFAVANGYLSGSSITAGDKVDGHTVYGAKISGGQVTLKVWEVKPNEYINYDGSGLVTITVTIGESAKDTALNKPYWTSNEVSVTFTDGDGGTVTPSSFTITPKS